MTKHILEYESQADWRVKENSNTVFSAGGLKNLLAETAMAKHILGLIPDNIKQLHTDHLVHFHDLGNGNMCYCAGWSVREILEQGLEVDARFPSSQPAKHFGTALEHILNHCFIHTMEFSGAMAYSSVDIYLAPFIKEDKLDYKQTKQLIQRLVFSLSQKYRTGLQSPFSNITLDIEPIGSMKDMAVIVGGKELDYTYSDCQKEIDMFNKAFCEVMSAGDGAGKPFSFPIPTYSITKDFDWDSEFAEMLFDMAVKTGIPYFSNYVNSDMDPEDARSMCCRLRLDKRELVKNGGGLFGAGEKTGSIGVATLNMPRIGYMAANPNNKQVKQVLKRMLKPFRKEFENCSFTLDRLNLLIDYCMDGSREYLVGKRTLVEDNLKKGLFPYTSKSLKDFSNHFNTLGLVGMNEALLNLGYPEGIIGRYGHRRSVLILDRMLSKLQDFQEIDADYYTEDYGFQKGLLWNLEATPAEGAGYKLAKYDYEFFKGDAIVSNGIKGVDPYYTNSTWLPQDSQLNENLFDALDHQDELQVKYTSGTVFHIYTEGLLTWRKGRDLIRKSCENYKMPYFSLSPTIAVCPIHGRLDRDYDYCPFEHTEEELETVRSLGGIIREKL